MVDAGHGQSLKTPSFKGFFRILSGSARSGRMIAAVCEGVIDWA
jgi:hypothetical protein